MDALPWTLLVCMCFAIALLFRPRHRHDGEESPIVFFRCISCDQLVKGPPTPFNGGRDPICNQCMVRHFPGKWMNYVNSEQEKAPQ